MARNPEGGAGAPRTLRDDEIKTERGIGRRTLFALVAGAAGAGLAACAAEPVQPPMFTDSDHGVNMDPKPANP